MINCDNDKVKIKQFKCKCANRNLFQIFAGDNDDEIAILKITSSIFDLLRFHENLKTLSVDIFLNGIFSFYRSQLCINTGIVYMHRFYAFHSFTLFHRNGIAAAAFFLAAKVSPQTLGNVYFKYLIFLSF